MSQPLDPTTARRRSLLQSLWFWVVLAFFILIGAWSTIIMLALKNKPGAIELEHEGQEQVDSYASDPPEPATE
ncbi:MAG: hypothetical protein Q7Q73_11410 [Verrucomicrobiota bacterium JB024]|jgi:hypothetical protein|nr:hypothetical protein [Verrucomicrobiota bacterium JB024]